MIYGLCFTAIRTGGPPFLKQSFSGNVSVNLVGRCDDHVRVCIWLFLIVVEVTCLPVNGCDYT